MLGFDIRWSEVPMIVKLGMVFWLVAILAFAYMVATAVIPGMQKPAAFVLNIAYLGGFSFIIGVCMMVIGLPGITNHKSK